MSFGYYTPEIFATMILILVIIATIFTFKFADRKLNTWASENRFEIVKVSSGLLKKNPFFFSLKKARVYYVLVRDKDGNERRCWVQVTEYGYAIDWKWE